MKRNTTGEIIFWSVALAAGALYWITAPAGEPWQAMTSTNAAWRYLVAMAGGSEVVLASGLAAVAGGLLGAMVNRYMGWRIGVAAALVWVTLPGVWSAAVTGRRGVCQAAAVVIALWAANALMLWVTRKARKARSVVVAQGGDAYQGGHARDKKRDRLNRIASWTVFGSAVAFALGSAVVHDHQLGEVASAYAKLIVKEAGERVILLNGVCDEQIERETERTISLSNDGETRSNLVAWVKREWPGETNLWLAAEIGPSVFAEGAMKAHPERLFVMNGQSTTPEKWAGRWEKMSIYLKSRDPFVPVMRRAFAYEGNYLGNGLQAKGDLKAAWKLYMRVFDEINPGNPAACVNLNEMLRRGYKVDGQTRMRVESAQADFAKLLTDRRKAARVAARIAQFGPVMRDEKEYEKMQERIRKRLEEMKKQGVKPEPSEELKTLAEWHAEMMKAFYNKELDKAAAVARAILSRPRWVGFVPAYMIMGMEMARKGEYVASEAFYRVAVEGKGSAAPTPFILNDYADVLRMLKRFGQAEKYARQAVEASDEKAWLFRLTLAQILRDAGKSADEVKKLVEAVRKNAPKDVQPMIDREFP